MGQRPVPYSAAGPLDPGGGTVPVKNGMSWLPSCACVAGDRALVPELQVEPSCGPGRLFEDGGSGWRVRLARRPFCPPPAAWSSGASWTWALRMVQQALEGALCLSFHLGGRRPPGFHGRTTFGVKSQLSWASGGALVDPLAQGVSGASLSPAGLCGLAHSPTCMCPHRRAGRCHRGPEPMPGLTGLSRHELLFIFVNPPLRVFFPESGRTPRFTLCSKRAVQTGPR